MNDEEKLNHISDFEHGWDTYGTFAIVFFNLLWGGCCLSVLGCVSFYREKIGKYESNNKNPAN